jgi:hypothetical protein
VLLFAGAAFRVAGRDATPANGSPSPALAAQQRGMQRGMSMPEMMKMHEQMMADMTKSQATLDGLAAKMNSATGDAKVAAMAELLNEIVRQHRMMGEHMAGMHQMGPMK